MRHHAFSSRRVHLLSLGRGTDVVGEITRFAAEHSIDAAWVSFLGAVRRASLRYYDQEALEYRDFTIDRHLEVLSGTGNLSTLDGEPFLHAHAAFADADGNAFGGHLAPGCEVWALEVRLEELEGDPLVRTYDEGTGLSLW